MYGHDFRFSSVKTFVIILELALCIMSFVPTKLSLGWIACFKILYLMKVSIYVVKFFELSGKRY